MSAALKKTPTKNTVKTIHDIRGTYQEITYSLNGLPEGLDAAKQLIKDDNKPTIGSKLIKTGIFLIVAVPEPFISDITGTALVATGFALNKLKKKDSVRDLITKCHYDMQEIEQFGKEIL